MSKDSAPTPSEIEKLYEQNRSDFASPYTAFAEDDKLYELEFGRDLGLPVEYKDKAVVLPTARSNVDTFADYIDITNASVKVARRKDTKEESEAQEQLIKFGSGLIFMTNVQAAISPWRVLAKHYPLYGVAWMKTVFNADLWPDKPQKKKGESDESYAERLDEWQDASEGQLPIVIQAVNPQNVMFDIATTGQDWVIEHCEKRVCDMVRKYPQWQETKKGKEYAGKLKEKVDYLDYWDKDYRCVLVGGEPILKTKTGVAKHGYGFVPYVCIDAGLGNMTSDNDLTKRFVGINRYLKAILISQSRDYSIVDVVVAKGGMPSGVLEGDDAMMVGKLDLSYGTFTPLPKGVTLKEVEHKMTPDQVTQHFAISGEIIDSYAGSPALRGLSQEGVRSGADRRQILAASQYRLRYSEMAFKHRTAEVLNNCARLLKIIPGNVRVWSHTPSDEFDDIIDKKKIKEPINFHVQFSPISEEDEYRKHDDYERMVQAGLVTREWARHQMPNVNAKDMERQELKERIRNSPAFAAFTDEMVGVMLRAASSQIMAAEGLSSGQPPPPTGGPQPQQQGQPQGQMPQGGMQAPIRATANPGSAAALQNQMAGNRSQVPMNPNQGRFGGGARGMQR